MFRRTRILFVCTGRFDIDPSGFEQTQRRLIRRTRHFAWTPSIFFTRRRFETIASAQIPQRSRAWRRSVAPFSQRLVACSCSFARPSATPLACSASASLYVLAMRARLPTQVQSHSRPNTEVIDGEGPRSRFVRIPTRARSRVWDPRHGTTR